MFLEEEREAELVVVVPVNNAELNAALPARLSVQICVHGTLFTEKRLEICRASISSSEVIEEEEESSTIVLSFCFKEINQTFFWMVPVLSLMTCPIHIR